MCPKQSWSEKETLPKYQITLSKVFRVYDHDHGDSLAIRRVDRHMGESEDIEKEKVINEELRRV